VTVLELTPDQAKLWDLMRTGNWHGFKTQVPQNKKVNEVMISE
jgi:hypothetical protein